MQTYCRDDAAIILQELGHIGLDNVCNIISSPKCKLSDKFLMKLSHLLDIYTLSGKQPMGTCVYDMNVRRLNWDGVSSFIEFNNAGNDFIVKHVDEVNLPVIISRMSNENYKVMHTFSYLIDKAFARGEMTDKLWKEVSNNSNITSKFMRKYELYLDWYVLSSNPEIPEDLILKYESKVDWSIIWRTKKFSDETLTDIVTNYMHVCNFNWTLISTFQTLSEEFIDKYKDNVDWCAVSEYQNMSYKFLRQHKDLIVLEKLLRNHVIDKSIIDNFVKNYEVPVTDDEFDDSGLDWGDFDDSTKPAPTPGDNTGGDNSIDQDWEDF